MDSKNYLVVDVVDSVCCSKRELSSSEFSSPCMLIVDPCSYGRLGWQAALSYVSGINFKFCSSFTEWSRVHYMKHVMCQGESFFRVIIRLSSDPRQALLQLLSLGEHDFMCDGLIVVSSFKLSVIIDVLACLNIQCPVSIITGWLPVTILSQLILNDINYIVVLPILKPLTNKERRALMNSLREMSAYQQAKINNRCIKTVYNHRRNALSKLGARSVIGLLRRIKGG